MPEHTMVRGDNKTIRVTVSDANGPLNLTSKTLEFTAKRNKDDAAAFIQKTTGAGITHLTQSGGTLGQADVALVAGDTSGLPAYGTTLFYEVELTDGSNTYTTEQGTLVVSPNYG